jgi:hypothetical protein
MFSLSARLAAIVATAPAPARPARGLDPRGPRAGCPCRSLAMPSARRRWVNSRRSGRSAARRRSAQRPCHSGARVNAPHRKSPIQPYEPSHSFAPNRPGRTLRQMLHATWHGVAPGQDWRDSHQQLLHRAFAAPTLPRKVPKSRISESTP